MADARTSEIFSLEILIPAEWDDLPTLAAGTELEAWSYDFTSLLNGEDLTITLDSTSPNWVSLDTDTHVLSGTVPDMTSNQMYEISVTISNEIDGVTYEDTAVFMLSVPDDIDAPVWANIPDPYLRDVGDTFTINLANFVTGEDSISHQSGTLPPNLRLSGTNLLGPFITAGTYAPVFRATNDDGSTDSEPIDFTISAPVPVWGTIATQELVVGTSYSLNLASHVTGEDSISHQSGTIPAGLSFSGTTLSGTPTDATDDGDLTFRATNDGGDSDKTITLTIAAEADLPVWTGFVAYTSQLGVPVSIFIGSFVTGEDDITLLSGTLPGATFNTSTHVLSGTFTTVGTYALVFQATNDGGSSNSFTMNWTINYDSGVTPPVWSTIATQSLTVGTAYSLGLGTFVTGEVFGGISHIGGTIPSGLTFTGVGLSGTPTDATDGGDLTFRAMNNGGISDKTITFTFT